MDGYHEFPSNIPSNLFCDGYFQSEKYFYDIREDLLNELIPKDELNSNEKLFLDSIKQSESVCLTIRLGDYINNSAHQVCTKDFYFMATAAAGKKSMERTMDALRGFTDCLPNANIKGYVYGAGVYEKGEIENTSYLKLAYDMGINS